MLPKRLRFLPSEINFFTIFALTNKNEFVNSQKNCDGISPLRFVLDSLCADNLHSLMESFDGMESRRLENLKIFNEKLDGGGNFLHMLINRFTSENYQDVAEMITVLLEHRCSPNLRNDQDQTPFYHLLAKLESINDKYDVINLFLKQPAVDSNLNNNNVIAMLNLRGFVKPSPKPEPIKNFSFMTQILDEFDEKRFISEFVTFENNSKESEVAQLMEAAIVRNLVEVVNVLLKNNVDVNRVPTGGKFHSSPPAFLACLFGHDRVLKLLLKSPELSFKYTQTTLLHQVCAVQKIHEGDRRKCFDLIVADSRCTSDIINCLDHNTNSPLFYAVYNNLNEIAKELLRRGAFIGHESVIDHIGHDVLGEFLDDCIKCSSNVNERNCEIHIDYRFLMPPNNGEKLHSEMHSVHVIAENSKLQKLILHPVISSFLQIKWRKIDYLVYINLLIFFVFMVFLGGFIINFFHANNGIQSQPHNSSETDDTFFKSRFGGESSNHPQVESFNLLHALLGINSNQSSSGSRQKRSVSDATTPKPNCGMKHQEMFKHYAWSYRICLVGVIIMTLYEIVQCFTSFKKYFFKLSNYLDVTLITLAYIVLIGWCSVEPEHFKKFRAITILVMAAQTIQLISKVSFMSMSLHMTMFTKVCATFLKTIALYLILILAFAMSFYTLNDDERFVSVPGDKKDDNENHESFSNPFVSIITTIRMMLSDFDKVNIEPEDYFQGLLFLLFVVFITVVLFNLLNALAISDTSEIIKNAELVDIKKRISILSSYEKVFKVLKLSFANIFPEMATFIITPNKDKIIRIKRHSLIVHDDFSFESHLRTTSESVIKTFFNKLFFWRKCNSATKMCNTSMEKITKFVVRRNKTIVM